MKKIVLPLIICAILVLSIASSGCILDGKPTYSSSELESQIVETLNEQRAENGLLPLIFSNKSYALCLAASQYNAEHSTLDEETLREIIVPDINSDDIPLNSTSASVIPIKQLSGDLKSDAEMIIEDLRSDLFTGENTKSRGIAPLKLFVQEISISCVINDEVIATSYVYSPEYITISYTSQELETEIVQQYLNEVNKEYRQNTLYSDRFVNECRDKAKSFIDGKNYWISDAIKSKRIYGESYGSGIALANAWYLINGGELTGNLQNDATVILNEFRKYPEYSEQWQNVCVGCYVDRYHVGATILIYDNTYW